MSIRNIPFVMNIVDPSEMSLTIDSDGQFTAVRGRRSNPIPCVITDRGQPEVTMSEVATADVAWYTDSQRNDPLGADDEANYNHEIRNIDMDAGTFDLIIDLESLTATPSNTTLYGYLKIEQG